MEIKARRIPSQEAAAFEEYLKVRAARLALRWKSGKPLPRMKRRAVREQPPVTVPVDASQ